MFLGPEKSFQPSNFLAAKAHEGARRKEEKMPLANQISTFNQLTTAGMVSKEVSLDRKSYAYMPTS